MAKGHQEHQVRMQALAGLGKDLARRSKSRCELTGAAGVPLAIYEVPPAADGSPDPDRCLFLDADLIPRLEKPAQLDASRWHHLNDLVWSETPAVQIMSLRLLQFFVREHPWASEILEQAYPEPEMLEAAEAAPLGAS